MRIGAAVAGVFVLTAMTLAGCSSASGGSGSPKVTMLSVEPAQGFDPNIAAANSSTVPMSYMYETLIQQDASGKWVGALAESWSVSSDGKTYTFKLRSNDGFSDGSKLTANDVVFTFDRLKTGKSQVHLASALQSVTARDNETVQFVLKASDRSFMNIVGTPGTAGILSKAAVQANSNYFSKPTATSGAWQLASYIPSSHIEFKVNPHYFSPPKITDIDYEFSSDPTSDVAAVESGSADFGSVDYSAVSKVKQNSGVRVIQNPALAPTFFAFDMTKPPFSDVRVRQAVAYADDRDALRKDCWFGTGLASYGNVLIPGSEYYVEVNTYKQAGSSTDLAKAEQLLDAAGWKSNGGKYRVAEGVAGVKDGTQLAVTVPYESNWVAAACHTQLLQSDLAKIGFKITPQAHDPASFYTDAGKNQFQMYHGGDLALNTIDMFENWFHSGGSATSLTTHLNDPAIDAEIDKAVSTPDEAEAANLFADLQQWSAANVPMLVDGFQYTAGVVSNRIKNYEPTSFGGSYALRMASVSS
jgi:peptide/nickel transport system substrate-binding protein